MFLEGAWGGCGQVVCSKRWLKELGHFRFMQAGLYSSAPLSEEGDYFKGLAPTYKENTNLDA
jgi:hypothetical protein